MNRFVPTLGLLCYLMLQPSLYAEPATPKPPPNRGPLWIGIKTAPASAVLRAQLALPKGRGIVVRNVTPDSPAAAAGLRVNDLLLVADQQILSRPRDLIRALDRSRNQRLAIEFLRGGQRQKIFVKPLARREAAKPTTRNPGNGDRPFLRSLIDQIAPAAEAGASDEENTRIIEGLLSNLPDNFQITLRRDAGGSPRFVIANEGQRWELDGRNFSRWGQALLPLAEGLLGSDAPAVAPPELGLEEAEVTIPQAEITLPAVELPSELPPLEEEPQSSKEENN